MEYEAKPDYDVRAKGLEDHYSGFGSRPIDDYSMGLLSDACARLPRNHIGFEAWITVVAGVSIHATRLKRWVVDLAEAVAKTRQRRSRARKRTVMASGWRRDWGRRAAFDGLMLALFGDSDVPSAGERAAKYKCRKESYLNVRTFVRDCVRAQEMEFVDALQRVRREGGTANWACAKIYDREMREMEFSALQREAEKPGNGFQIEKILPVEDSLILSQLPSWVIKQ